MELRLRLDKDLEAASLKVRYFEACSLHSRPSLPKVARFQPEYKSIISSESLQARMKLLTNYQ